VTSRARKVTDVKMILRRYLLTLSPYTCLFLVAAPLAIIEPLKVVAVFACGKGHWIIGLIALFSVYLLGLFLVERLFKIVKPKLMKLSWFAVSWNWFVALRKKASQGLFLSLSGHNTLRLTPTEKQPRREAEAELP
jgi:hypothetical protein